MIGDKLARLIAVDRARTAKLRTKAKAAARARLAEECRFFDRRRFDQGAFWRQQQQPEPRSYPGSTWPALENAVRIWGLPAGFRSIPWNMRDLGTHLSR